MQDTDIYFIIVETIHWVRITIRYWQLMWSKRRKKTLKSGVQSSNFEDVCDKVVPFHCYFDCNEREPRMLNFSNLKSLSTLEKDPYINIS